MQNRENPGRTQSSRGVIAFHLLDCYAGLRNLDAALGHARWFVGRRRKHDPSHGICSGQQFRDQTRTERSPQKLCFPPNEIQTCEDEWQDNACRNVPHRPER